VAFRISLAHTKNPQALSAWLRIGELQVKDLELADYDKKAFRASLNTIKELAYEMREGFEHKLKSICAEAGVALVYTPNLSKAPISGATRWYLDTPLIQLSGRYKTDDHFWFTFFHEAGHILLHGKKDIFLEGMEGAVYNKEKEKEANQFASKCLLTKKQFEEIVTTMEITSDLVEYYAKEFRTPKGAIVGRLQHDGYIHYSKMNDLKRKVDLFNKNKVEL